LAASLELRDLFNQMSDLSDRIVGLREQAKAKAQASSNKGEQKKLLALAEAADGVRKKIVATTEGGAITGEERLREHTDSLYGAIVFFEGRPGGYHLERIKVLRQDLEDVEAEFAKLIDKQAKPLQMALRQQGIEFDLDARALASGSGGNLNRFATQLSRFTGDHSFKNAAGVLHKKQ
jgi:hypothetical protein